MPPTPSFASLQYGLPYTIWQAITTTNPVVGKFSLEGLECYKDTQIKAYDIAKLTAETKSDNVHYSEI